MKQTQVLRVLNPDTFAFPPTAGLFQRAFQDGVVEIFEPALLKVLKWTETPGAFIAVGWEEGEPKGLAICLLPSETTFKEPLLYMLHNEGPVRLRRDLVCAVLDWMTVMGYTSLITADWGWENTTINDVERIFRDAGEVKLVAPLYRIWTGERNAGT